LNGNIVEVFLLYGSAGLDLNETPSTVPPAMQDVHPHYHSVVLKSSLKERRNFRVGD